MFTQSFDPVLPEELKGCGWCVRMHGRLIELRVSGEEVCCILPQGKPITIIDRGNPPHLTR